MLILQMKDLTGVVGSLCNQHTSEKNEEEKTRSKQERAIKILQ